MIYVWLYFFLFGEAIFGQILVLQSLFSHSKYAGLVSTIMYFMGTFFYFPVQGPDGNVYLKLLFSAIFPQVCNREAAIILAGYELSGIGINMKNADDIYEKLSFNQCLWSFLISFVLWMLLGIYLEAVLPKEYGTKRHPCFMFHRSTY